MLLSKFFRRRKSVVERIEAYTSPRTITVELPATVDGALLAIQIEHQLKRRPLT